MRAAGLVAFAAAAVTVAAPAASAATAPVSIRFQAFAPSRVEVLPGDTVEWTNASERRHTVTAVDASLDSGDLFEGDRFARQFDEVGSFPYYCTAHLTMTGAVEVHRVTLDPLPSGPVPAGPNVQLSGRVAHPSAPVTIERDVGTGFRAVAVANAAADGTWSAPVAAATSADYRATTGTHASQTRRLLVIDRQVRVRATRRGVHVTVSPPDPNAVVVLQLRLRERFGWWPAKRARLDYLSRADFRVTRPALARVALVDRDGWTAVATSPVIHLGRPD